MPSKQKHSRIATHLAALLAACLLGISTGSLAQAPDTHPTLLRALNAIRLEGCGAAAARAPALREVPALSRAAALVASGRTPEESIAATGYRPLRFTRIMVGGFTGPAALTSGVLGSSCPTVLPPYLRDVGFYQRGKQTWVVLAEPFAVPEPSRGKEVEARVLALVNAARAQPRRCGNVDFPAVPPLMLQSLLTGVAAGHAADMARNSYFSHFARDGSAVDVRATRAGYRWRAIGENIAAGQRTPEAVVQSWLDSPSHCGAVMAPHYEEMGLAFVVNLQSKEGIYWVQVFGAGR
ncbi:MAG: CAP domain-containing protein [Polaromonas sp.]|nr:CAP domain-containing protein [Polaromonas sp.]